MASEKEHVALGSIVASGGLTAAKAIVGFATGCGLGALYEAAAGLSSLALPTCLALLAFAMCLTRSRLAFRNTIG